MGDVGIVVVVVGVGAVVQAWLNSEWLWLWWNGLYLESGCEVGEWNCCIICSCRVEVADSRACFLGQMRGVFRFWTL